MWDALQAVGIKGMLICQWGVPYATDDGLEGPNAWTKGLSTSFRLSDDIATGWSHVYRIYNQAVHIARSGRIGPDHFADADMLEVGNEGMTQAEQATHFAAWAMLKSALMISTDVAALSSESVALLQNKGLIEINQDAAAKPVELVQRYTGDHDVWSGPLDNGDLAVLVVDLSNTTRTLDLDLSELGLASATVRDLWDGSVTEGASSISKEVDAHGSLALRLSGLKVSDSEPEYEYTPFSEGTLTNGASLASCSGCNASKVVNVGGDEQGTVELKGIRTSQGTQDVLIDYINCEVGYLGATNERLASVKVNDGEEQVVSFPLSGYNWDRDVYRGYRVRLSGFDVDGVNTVTVSGEGWGPDLVRIGVVA